MNQNKVLINEIDYKINHQLEQVDDSELFHPMVVRIIKTYGPKYCDDLCQAFFECDHINEILYKVCSFQSTLDDIRVMCKYFRSILLSVTSISKEESKLILNEVRRSYEIELMVDQLTS